MSAPDYVKGGGTFGYPSATCYFSGKNLYDYYHGSVAIGLVHSSYGGTPVEAWSSPDALNDKTCGGI